MDSHNELPLAHPPKKFRQLMTDFAGYVPRWYTHPKTVSHLGTNLPDVR